MRDRHVQRALSVLARMEKAVAFCAFMVLIGVIFADVVSRELTGAGIHWAPQIGVYAHLVVVMAGLGMASAEGTHLRPQFADRWLPAAWEPVVARLQTALTAAFFAGLAAAAVAFVAESRALAETSAVLGTPLWPVQSIMPLAFFSAALRHVCFAIWPQLGPRTESIDTRGADQG